MKLRIAVIVLVMAMSACCPSAPSEEEDKPQRIRGGGSSFIAPMMKKWSEDYLKAKGGEIDYTSTGSSNGVSHLLRGIVDFACTDLPLTAEQLKQAKASLGDVIHVPLMLGAVVVVYNLTEVKEPLQLTGPVVADIFLGKITRWNDPAIKGLNAGIDLPNKEIIVAHRGDRSGTTALFTDYLSKVSKKWKEKVGAGWEVKWPVGATSPKAIGMGGFVGETPGAIGYVELTYLKSLEERPLKHAKLKNRDGCFVEASLTCVTATAENALADIPEDLCFSLTNVSGKDSYPICGAVWAVVYAKQTGDRGKRLADFLGWVTHEGQESVTDLYYARLTKGLVQKVNDKLGKIQ
jgi:phosphate transport system substrate-binding protein